MKHIILLPALALCLHFFSLQVFSQTDPNDSTIVITASRSWNSVVKEGKSITIITEDDIKNSGKKTLPDILESVPGVTVTRNGADGGLANVFIRGGQRGNVLIMVDGVKINDPMGIEKAYNISLIGLFSVERIEIVRGAMSSMYGAEASGGVINIITKGGAKGLGFSAEAGSGRSFDGVFSAGTESSFFSVARTYTNGISQAKKNLSVPSYDKDAYSNTAVTGRIKKDISDTASLNFVMNYTDSKTDLDLGAFQDDPNYTSSNKLFTSKGEFSHSLFSWWTYKAGVSYMSYARDYINPDDLINPYGDSATVYTGSNMGAEFISVFNILDIDRLTIGFELFDEKGSSTSGYYDDWSVPANPGYVVDIFKEKSVLTRSAFIHNALSIGIWNLNTGARLDSHELFGSHITWDASSSISIPVIGTVLRSSVGTGFRAPSLYELYDPAYGNPDLEPEESFIYDAGIYQEIFEGLISFDASIFKQRYKNVIEWGWAAGYENGGKESNKGAEASIALRPADFLTLAYGFTTLRYDKTVPKRPRNTHNASALVSFKGLNVMLMYLYTGARTDQSNRLASYHKLDLNARYSVNENIGLSLRCVNLTDAAYEDSYGYNTRRRSFYGGMDFRM
ncbi:MAG: TonB-dependent receptor [Leptospirales bacterium]|nr:TonB-dependent receptor [Leptospirales bacterium]